MIFRFCFLQWHFWFYFLNFIFRNLVFQPATSSQIFTGKWWVRLAELASHVPGGKGNWFDFCWLYFKQPLRLGIFIFYFFLGGWANAKPPLFDETFYLKKFPVLNWRNSCFTFLFFPLTVAWQSSLASPSLQAPAGLSWHFQQLN